ncbi:MAG TPA: DUF4159 domain-containing protein [Gemmatimonadaceae bacterium]|nr:DUF4159 domain-containing protein [Gemmatimonadaceae bacterium]
MNSRRSTVLGVLGAIALASLAAPLIGLAQDRFGGEAEPIPPNSPYDGRYTFVRIRYEQSSDGGFRGYRSDVKWAHDYPRGERHFTKIVGEISSIRSRTAESNIFTLDDPELTKYPVAYLCEPGFWRPSDAEVLGLRNYLLKGGFIIFDDFAGNQWENFQAQMRRVFPDLQPMRMTPDDRVFDAFYHITTLNYNHPYFGMPSEFWGIYENNDRNGRLLAMINYNNDLSEYWEFSDEQFFPVNMSNDAYKLGVNYLVYALTR